MFAVVFPVSFFLVLLPEKPVATFVGHAEVAIKIINFFKMGRFCVTHFLGQIKDVVFILPEKLFKLNVPASFSNFVKEIIIFAKIVVTTHSGDFYLLFTYP